MKNRSYELCLKNNISTPEEYARKIGVSVAQALEILNQNAFIDKNVLKRNCEIFGVSETYFLCLE